MLGLPESARHEDGAGALRSVWLDLGGAILMVERTDEPARRVEGVGAGPFLIALAVEPEERAGLERALEAAGAPIEAHSAYSSYSRDPEGNRVAISHYPAPAAGASGAGLS